MYKFYKAVIGQDNDVYKRNIMQDTYALLNFLAATLKFKNI